MGKHLDHLVDQTEKFSTSLAIDIQVRGSVNPFEVNEEELLIPPPHWKAENSQTSLLSSISMGIE
jgi:hypothetical protein